MVNYHYRKSFFVNRVDVEISGNVLALTKSFNFVFSITRRRSGVSLLLVVVVTFLLRKFDFLLSFVSLSFKESPGTVYLPLHAAIFERECYMGNLFKVYCLIARGYVNRSSVRR